MSRKLKIWGTKEDRNRAVVRGYTKRDPKPSMSELAEEFSISKDRVQAIIERWRLLGHPDPDD